MAGTMSTVPPVTEPRTIDLPPLSVRAAVTPASINKEARTVDLVFSTGAPVRRYDWSADTYYLEKLSLDPKHVRLGRLNSGAPLLDTHSGWSLESQLGVVEDGTAKVNGSIGTATVRFSSRPYVDDAWTNVAERIVRNVSVGYMVYAYEEVNKVGELPVRTAIDWEPYEISLVPMPADPGAQTRDGKPEKPTLRTYPCQIITRGETATIQEPAMQPEETRTAEDQPELIVERVPAVPAQRAADPPVEPNDTDRGIQTERERVNGIMLACRAARLGVAFQDKLINDGVSLLEAQTRVFKVLQGQEAPASRGQIEMGTPPEVHERAGIAEALLHRASPTAFPMTERGRAYRGLTILGVGEMFLKARGIRTSGMSPSDLAGLVLGLNQRGAGYHTTSDFPELLADVANKTMQKAYEEAPQTFSAIARQITAKDFKNINMTQFGEAPTLLEVKQHGEYTRGTIVDSKETFALKTYGRIFAITRQAIINDDMSAFSTVPMKFGRQARVLESDLIWAQITGNPTMGDGNALFSSAHSNLETDGDHIDINSLSRARKSIRVQKGQDGVTRLNLTPKYLIVPPSLETKAAQFTSQITPATAANQNPFSGLLQVVAEPRLEDNSVTAWYMASDNALIDIVVYAFLEGQTGPTIEQRVGFDVDGVEIKARHDVAALVVDWRGIHKDPGDLDS